jgi:hypothetical protein
MPILIGSALRAKQVSMAVKPTKTILGEIIRSVFDSRFGGKKSENAGLFHRDALHRK